MMPSQALEKAISPLYYTCNVHNAKTRGSTTGRQVMAFGIPNIGTALLGILTGEIITLNEDVIPIIFVTKYPLHSNHLPCRIKSSCVARIAGDQLSIDS